MTYNEFMIESLTKQLHPEIKSKLDKTDIVIFALVPIVAILVFVIEMFVKR